MKPPNEVPSAAEFGKIISHIAKSKIKPADVIKRIGNKPAARTRAQITAEIIQWLKEGKL